MDLRFFRMHAALPILAAAMLVSTRSPGAVVQITSNAMDGEVRQSSAGVYSLGQPVAAELRVGFQSSFGSDGAAAGGINALWFFQLPILQPGQSLSGAEFVTTLMDENAQSPITPRFNADLYALGFVSSPAAVTASATSFFAGQLQTGAGFGANQQITRIDDDLFTVFTDVQDVNTVSPKRPKPISTDEAGRLALVAYLQGVYGNPNFANDGSQFLVMRLNPDRRANETYEENGTQPYAKGSTRYRVAANESSSLTGTVNNVDYSGVIPTRLTLDVIPEPGSLGLCSLGVLYIAARRRRDR